VWDPLEEAYQNGLTALRRFVEREGHARVPLSHKEGEFSLGSWVSNQRPSYNDKRLSAERIADLDALGFVWEVR